MARSVATSIWQKYFQDDPFNEENGMKYRQECLSHGGGKPSKQLVSDFLGESLVTPDGLADALIADIDSKNKIVQGDQLSDATARESYRPERMTEE